MSPPAFNLYGDSRAPGAGGYGVDISSQRMDELDIEAMLWAISVRERPGTAVDLGCGLGMQGLRFAAIGLRTLLVDRAPVENTVAGLSGIDRALPISYVRKDARSLEASDLPDRVSLCYSQRFIHYLRFGEAVNVLRLLRGRMTAGARLYLSASGLHSELGAGYADDRCPVESRYAALAPAMSVKHDIHEKVCLYTGDELATLCRAASFDAERVFISAFGNVKGVFVAA